MSRAAAVRALRAAAHYGGVLLGLCGIALLWAGVFYALSVERELALRGAAQNTSNLARALEEHIVRTIKAVDQTLLLIREAYGKNPTSFDIRSWTRSTKALTDVDSLVGVIGPDGTMIMSNFPSTGAPVNLSDREHFLVHRDNPRDELFISKPVLGRVTHNWTVQMTRKMIAPDGSFGGVAVMALDPGYLSRFYSSVDVGKKGVITVTGVDGTILATGRGRNDRGTSAVGVSLAGSAVIRAYEKASSGTLTTESQSDGIRRVFSYRGVRDYPLIVIVGIAEDEVLNTYASNRVSYFVLASLVTVILVAVAILNHFRQNRLRRAREQLRASEAAYAQKSNVLQTTLEYMSQGILMLDPDCRIKVCNRWVIDKLGLPEDLMASLPPYNDILIWQWRHGEFGDDDRDIDAWSRQLELADIASDKPRTCEHSRPNGTVLEIRSTPAPGGGVVLTYTDITPRKKYEAELKAAREEADRAAKVKSEFLATMSHEIRSPMSGMLGVLEILNRTNLDDDQSRMTNMVQSSASGLLAVLNDILDFSKIEAEALSIVPETVNLRGLVNGIVQPHVFAAARKGVGLTARFDPEVPDYIEIDPLRLRQIINNLLANSVKFTAEGEIELAVDTVSGETNPRLRLVVRDTGIGMTADVIARLFEPFMQADSSTTRIFGGTGLGLSISRRLARLLDGDLVVTSRPGEGSEFALLIPLVATAPPNDTSETIHDPATLGGLGAEARVLVADDDPANRWVARRMVEILGLNADAVEDGEMALQALHAREYILLITDCHMPRMDGVALTRAVRGSSNPVLRGLPIIGLTADVTAEQRERCHAAGMTDVDIKPLTIERLSRLLSRHLGGARGNHHPNHPGGHQGETAIGPPVAATAVELAASEPTSFDDRIYREIFPDGDPDGESWINEYQDAAENLNGELRTLLSVVDDDALRRDVVAAAAHRLAGSSYSVGASLTGTAARALEHAALTESLASLLALHLTTCGELAAAKMAMSKFLSLVAAELTS